MIVYIIRAIDFFFFYYEREIRGLAKETKHSSKFSIMAAQHQLILRLLSTNIKTIFRLLLGFRVWPVSL